MKFAERHQLALHKLTLQGVASLLTVGSCIQHNKASVHISLVAFIFEHHGISMTPESVHRFIEVDLMIRAFEGP